MKKGLIHIYTGDGKGKTTAALGLAVRARSRGLRVMLVQFFKERQAGVDIHLLGEIGIESRIFDKVKSPYFNPSLDINVLRREADDALSRVKEIISEERHDLIVLDEFICLVSENVLAEDKALEFLSGKPFSLELVLTGRGATERLMNSANYVTEMKMIKHPYAENIKARRGIEF